MFKNILFIFLGLLAVKAQAAPAIKGSDILVISDIDDTIKLSHVLRKRSASVRALDSNSWFLGMNSLYQLIQNDNPGAYFAYISAAPEFMLEETHKKLIANGQFPFSEYVGRNHWVSSLNHKLTAIRKILSQRKPKTVIFIGDNGEKDPVVYHQITNEYKSSGIQFHTFIRMVYSSQNPEYAKKLQPVSSEQFVFLTPVELGLELRRKDLISETSNSWLLDKLIDFIDGETPSHRFGVLAFPSFLDCRGFKWPFLKQPGIIAPIELDPFFQKKLMKLIDKIADLCSKTSININED